MNRARLAVVTVLAIAAMVAEPGPATAAKKVDACKVLSSTDISAAFPDAPLLPQPVPTTSPDPRMSICTWASGPSSAAAPHRLNFEVRLLSVPSGTRLGATNPDTTPLTSKELKGVGSSGVVWISSQSGATTGQIRFVKGKTQANLSASYAGLTQPIPQVDRAAFLDVARKAAKKI